MIPRRVEAVTEGKQDKRDGQVSDKVNSTRASGSAGAQSLKRPRRPIYFRFSRLQTTDRVLFAERPSPGYTLLLP